MSYLSKLGSRTRSSAPSTPILPPTEDHEGFKGSSIVTKPATVLFDDGFWNEYKDDILQENKDTGGDTKQSNSKNIFLKNLFDKSNSPSSSQVSASLLSQYSNKDITKAYELIRYFKLSEQGHFIKVQSIDKSQQLVELKGAENWGNVMCYLDALLFSMFAKMENFEPLLLSFDDRNRLDTDSNNKEDIKISRLRGLLRVYISLLRSGQLITTDLTRLICKSLYDNGFEEALSRKQEDSSQLFIFLTEILNMPLLTLKIDIAHGGKEVKQDDHRYTKERMLYVSIPSADDEINGSNPKENQLDEVDEHPKENKSKVNETESTKGISKETKEQVPQPKKEKSVLLEECLEHYFNNSIHVKRQLEKRLSIRRNTLLQQQLNSLMETKDVDNTNDGNIPSPEDIHQKDNKTSPEDDSSDFKVQTEHIESSTENTSEGSYKVSDLGTITYDENEDEQLKSNTPTNAFAKSVEDSATKYSRSYSISKDGNYNVTSRSRANSSISIFSDSKNGEVSLPAWMFLQLLPFYTDLEPNSQTEQSFAEKRPILPICLKRYTFGKNSKKNCEKVIIPPFIDLPTFIAEEDEEETADSESNNTKNFGKFRLVLESAVCHRGHSINSGHYISLVRNDEFDPNATEDSEDSKTWLLFDDLSETGKVKPISFKQAFSQETPYILLYRMEPYVPKIITTTPSEEDLTKRLNTLEFNATKELEMKSKNLPNDRKKSDTSTLLSSEQSFSDNSSDIISNKKSHDLITKMVFHNSSYPYPNSTDYVDITNRYYWKYKTSESYIEETSSYLIAKPLESEPETNKRNSWSSVRSITSDMQLDYDEASLGVSTDNLNDHKKLNNSVGSLWNKRLSIRRKSNKSETESNKQAPPPSSSVEKSESNINLSPTTNLVPPYNTQFNIKVPNSHGTMESSTSSLIKTPVSNIKSQDVSPKVFNIKPETKTKHKPSKKNHDNPQHRREKYKKEKCIII